MATERSSKSIAERVDLDFHRQGNRFRLGRWRMSLVALLAALVLPAWAMLIGNERWYQAEGVSQAHQLIANDCGRCHVTSWNTALRLASLDDGLVSVADESCTVCHSGPAHHKDQPSAATRCADCHREHRGRNELARATDTHCTQCHAALETTHGPSRNFARSIDGFTSHPQFAVLRAPGEDPPGTEHQIHKIARQIDGKWRDGSTLRFNHKKHAGPDGLLRLDGTRQALRCEHCHQIEPSNGYMRPIDHERHCAACHGNQLHFDEQRFASAKVTHGSLPSVRGELVDRYASLASRQPQLARDEPRVEPEREVPGTSARLSETGWKWVNQRLSFALDQLFNRKQLGCRYCHNDVKSDDDDPQQWTVNDPRIPARWLAHCVFRHDRHQLLSCTECHQQAITSSDTADILLPGIENCRQCHGSKQTRGSARSDCVECHIYHHGEKPIDGPLSLDLMPVKSDNAGGKP
jgi:hypothetical protein